MIPLKIIYQKIYFQKIEKKPFPPYCIYRCRKANFINLDTLIQLISRNHSMQTHQASYQSKGFQIWPIFPTICHFEYKNSENSYKSQPLQQEVTCMSIFRRS